MIAPGDLLGGRYLIQRLLAQGGTADVFGAYDTSLKVHRVVKVAARPDPTSARRWLELEQAFLSGAREPSFPACYDWLTAEGALVLEHCPGRPLDRVSLPKGPTALLGLGRRLLQRYHVGDYFSCLLEKNIDWLRRFEFLNCF